MRVVLLGTGAADGWPNPFCRCASCAAAAADGPRAQSAALVDDTLLLDCGPEAPRAAVRLGHRLDRVRHVLLTHGHPDHVGPAALLYRSWVRGDAPLDVWGPAAALDLCRDWVGPDTVDTVRLHPVQAGAELDLDGHRVLALAGAHEVETLLWQVSGPDRHRLLWATDTGPLPAETVASLSGTALDLLLLEETFGDVTDHGTGHLDLASFPRELARLRAVGALTERSRMVPVHLGHRNPPPAELARRLAAWGAELLPDGAVLDVGSPGRRPSAPRRTLVLGGARSGKSVEAERLCAGCDDVTYVATGGQRAGDQEWAARIAAHRSRRPPSWTTLETTDLEPLLRADGGPLLIDCLSLWLTAVLDAADAWADPAALPLVAARIDELVAAWRSTPRRVVAVSNEVGSGVVPATAAGRLFRDELGRLNARLAAESDDVRLLVAGHVIPLRP